jgi:hypothetical protein
MSDARCDVCERPLSAGDEPVCAIERHHADGTTEEVEVCLRCWNVLHWGDEVTQEESTR